MSDIEFQNGFICGMATKGLIKAGNPYEPLIYNDEGVYDYFYIDFKQAVSLFSLGMFDSSIVVMSTGQLSATKIERLSPTGYKIYCDITNALNGIVVTGKKTGYLTFSNGIPLDAFSVHMYVLGQGKTTDLGYHYERVENARDMMVSVSNISESESITLQGSFTIDGAKEVANYKGFTVSNITESHEIVLTGGAE